MASRDEGISICVTMKNRASLFKYCLESITRQTAVEDELFPVEVCIADGGSTDNLINLIDRYSEVFPIRYAVSDRRK